IQRNHGENEQAEEKFPRAAAGKQALQPRTSEPFQRYIEQHKRSNDQQHGRQHARFGDRGSGSHRQQPDDRRERRKIGEPIGQSNDGKRAKAQRKTQEHAKREIRSESRDKEWENLPEIENAPE